MENEIRVTVTGKSLADVAQQMVAMGQSALKATSPVEVTEPTPKKGRGKKAKAEEIEEDLIDEDETSDVEDLDEETEETEDEEIEEDADEETEDVEDEEPAKIDAKQLAQLKKALNSYSTKNGKPKAVKILHKYAKVSQDVKADDFAKVMKALKI